jgi:hypothetical protein
MRILLLVTLGVTCFSGCTWVKLSPQGEGVLLARATDVLGCEKLGTTTASLKADIAGFSRNPSKVQLELETLARNSAADLGGDTIVHASEIELGKQEFDVYLCSSK